MLGTEASTLARQLAQPLRMHGLGGGWVEIDSAQAAELLDDTGQCPMTGCRRRLPRPCQYAHGRILRSKERVECGDLLGAQGAGELVGDMALGRTRAAAMRRSTTLGPGATIRRRRNSSINAAAIVEAFVG